MEHKIRNGNKDDLQLAYDIRKNALGAYITETWGWDEQWQWDYHLKDFNPEILYIIEVDGKAAATIEIIQEEDAIVISGLYILDSFQSKGLGSELMIDVIKKAEKENKNVRLQVLFVNKRAYDFYIKLGFQKAGEKEKHYQMIYETGKNK